MSGLVQHWMMRHTWVILVVVGTPWLPSCQLSWGSPPKWDKSWVGEVSRSRSRSRSRIIYYNTSYRKVYTLPPSSPGSYADLFRAPLHEVCLSPAPTVEMYVRRYCIYECNASRYSIWRTELPDVWWYWGIFKVWTASLECCTTSKGGGYEYWEPWWWASSALCLEMECMHACSIMYGSCLIQSTSWASYCGMTTHRIVIHATLSAATMDGKYVTAAVEPRITLVVSMTTI